MKTRVFRNPISEEVAEIEKRAGAVKPRLRVRRSRLIRRRSP
jgi:hypothetical protein